MRCCRSICMPTPTRAVTAGLSADSDEGDHKHPHRPAYRLYEAQNGNHIETYKDTFPQLELIQPHAQNAFDLLVKNVEDGGELPPVSASRGAARSPLRPAQPGHCAQLFVP